MKGELEEVASQFSISEGTTGSFKRGQLRSCPLFLCPRVSGLHYSQVLGSGVGNSVTIKALKNSQTPGAINDHKEDGFKARRNS